MEFSYGKVGIELIRDTGESLIQGDMIRMPLPHGGFTLYPYKFAYDAINFKKYSLFVTKGPTDQDVSLLMATHLSGAKTILQGPYNELVTQFLSIPWKENIVATSEGPMFRKIAPSLKELDNMIEILNNNN